MKRSIDELLQTSYWIIDILPEQVPAGSPGQFFAVEKYYLGKKRLADIKQKHLNVILKLNCYRDIYLEDESMANPSPEQIEKDVFTKHLCVRVDDSLIVSEPDDTYLTVFDPDEKLLELVRTLSQAEGLFVWKPQN